MSRKPSTDPESQRQVIKDAMDRLLTGEPIRSDGKLTVKSLAAEAGVKRWVLTHQHPDLQDEFRSRMERQTPEAVQAAASENAGLKKRVQELSTKVAAMSEENHRLVRIIQVLTLENQQMRDAGLATQGKVRRIRPADEPLRGRRNN